MSEKKVVHYNLVLTLPKVGLPALVWPVDHPSEDVSNKGFAQTTPVEKIVSIQPCIFETQNTRYEPALKKL
jgi:hypothetical protein